jgi:hypothetical protein
MSNAKHDRAHKVSSISFLALEPRGSYTSIQLPVSRKLRLFGLDTYTDK